MDDQLGLLISLYEEEKMRLQKLIEESLADEEFLMAHHYQTAFYQINGRLQTLNNILDRLYDEKRSRKDSIRGFERLKDHADSDRWRQFHEEQIRRTKEELEKLNQIPIKPVAHAAVTLLDETLAKLTEGKIKNLRLILSRKKNLLFVFTYSKKILKTTLPNVKQHMKDYILDDDDINSFKGLGFELTNNGNRLILILTGNKEEIITELKLILSKIVFDIFYFRNFDKESFIEFTEKT